jgi:hypothetical protein
MVAFLMVGFSPVKVNAYDCGSVFHPKQILTGYAFLPFVSAPGPCHSARSSREALTWVLLASGLIAAFGAVTVRKRENARPLSGSSGDAGSAE